MLWIPAEMPHGPATTRNVTLAVLRGYIDYQEGTKATLKPLRDAVELTKHSERMNAILVVVSIGPWWVAAEECLEATALLPPELLLQERTALLSCDRCDRQTCAELLALQMRLRKRRYFSGAAPTRLCRRTGVSGPCIMSRAFA